MKTARTPGFTLIEMTVVLLILAILTTISISVFTGYSQRARVTRAHTEIALLSQAITSYETDLGQLPPSRSQSTPLFTYANQLIPGDGFLVLALTRGIVGTVGSGLPLTGTITTDPLWRGPYLDINQSQLVDFARFATRTSPTANIAITSATLPADVCMADPWGTPYSYVRNPDYGALATPTPLRATLIVNSPFTGFYNPSTYQIYSAGPDRVTLPSSNPPLVPLGAGLGADDINNFNSP